MNDYVNDYQITSSEVIKFIDFLEKDVGKRKKIPALLIFLKKNPQVISKYLAELDNAITLFNKIRKQNLNAKYDFVMLNHARKLSVYLGERELPSVKEIIKLSRKGNFKQKDFVRLINQFSFLDTMEPPSKLAAAFSVLLYRSALLVVWEDLQKAGAMIGSTLEEMACLMAISGNRTKIFDAVKDWIVDTKEEGFSKELANKIRNL